MITAYACRLNEYNILIEWLQHIHVDWMSTTYLLNEYSILIEWLQHTDWMITAYRLTDKKNCKDMNSTVCTCVILLPQFKLTYRCLCIAACPCYNYLKNKFWNVTLLYWTDYLLLYKVINGHGSNFAYVYKQ